MERKKIFSLNWILLAVLISSNLLGQNTGKIVGTVKDAETGAALPGANVILEGTMLGAASDLEGRFVIMRVPPGRYTLIANYIGYQRTSIQNVQVLTDLTTTVNFVLKPEAIAGEEVVIVAEAPAIRKDLTSVEARVQAEDIKRMPVQEVGDLLNIQAGITRDAGGAIHIRGGRSTEVSYMVNGISITDDFSRSQALQVENESIQELQVISGTFNAEYGNAMSGVINVVTKTGSGKLQGNLELWSGDYVSSRKDIFWNIDDYNPADIYNYQGTLSGPIIKNKMSFFLTGRRWRNEGWLYGPNAYLPQGRSKIVDGDTIAVRGDSSAVPMNYNDRWSGQAALEWQIATPLKFRIDALGSFEKKRYYNHFYKLNPNGDKGDKEKGLSVIPKFTYLLGKTTYFELTMAYRYNDLVSKLYERYDDPRYVHPDSLNTGAQQFAKAGTNMGWFERHSLSRIAKWDLTSQVSKRHQVKFGVEFQSDKVYYNDITLIPKVDENGIQVEPFQPYIDDISTFTHNEFTRRPFKFAGYIQDKIEYESLIINLGLRYDYFDANGKIPRDPEDPNIFNPFKLNNIYRDTNGNGVIELEERTADNQLTVADREKYWYRSSTPKTQLSPRLGVAYPITEHGVIHFSFGIFQQVPEYYRLYIGDQIKLSKSAGTYGPYGNPDLKPERNTMYELGLKQQIAENLVIDVTGFYRDIRNWISTSPVKPTILSGVNYVIYNNRDFANVRGITFSLDKKFSDNYAFTVDYTFQIVEGTNSNPEEEFYSQQGGAEPTKFLTPLDWDQRHTLNANLFVGGNTWGASFISRFNTGQPYTPVSVTATRTGQSILAGLPDNSRNKPNIFTVDFNIYKNVRFRNLNFQLFMKIFNLFDAENPIVVYGDTGRPDYTLLLLSQAAQADPTWFDNPSFYSEPRRVQVGTRISF
ncbi:MAG: TonB-dependent receptor [candidate division KSB1 bacterium]|nr:TonB-dependent receptor [candidate division KSB1 bacterium]MDZ7356636.1 TonB-dependent receptor [candidate division KSB1 bacterium]MDZ7398990.1 TonB-dependent receptor [candidate division KSB1 bacterium]